MFYSNLDRYREPISENSPLFTMLSVWSLKVLCCILTDKLRESECAGPLQGFFFAWLLSVGPAASKRKIVQVPSACAQCIPSKRSYTMITRQKKNLTRHNYSFKGSQTFKILIKLGSGSMTYECQSILPAVFSARWP